SAPSAAGRFFFLLPDSFFFSFLFLLLSFVPFLLTRTAFRNAPGDVFSGKESHSSPELSDTLKTYENQSGRGAYFSMLCLAGFSEKNIKKAGVCTPACENINYRFYFSTLSLLG
ncbi:hypothetical protein, partial [Phocaeicola sp.]